MDSPVFNKKKGLSLKNTFTLMLAVSVIITVILLITLYGTIRSFQALSRATDAYMDLQQAASSLLAASDYLTEEAQCYSVLGSRVHMDNYFEEAEQTCRREKAVQVMEEYLPDSEALQDLKDAMQESLSLMNREYYAMRLVLDSQGDSDIPAALQNVVISEEDQSLSPNEKRILAEKMLHDEVYYAQKNVIRQHLRECVSELQNVTRTAQVTATAQTHRDLIWMTIMIVIQSAGMVLTLTLTTKLGINPILNAVDHIRDDQVLPIMGASEFRYLAETYNKMYSAYKNSVENLSYKASHDNLTGVYNRAGYDLIKQSVDMKTTAFLLFDADCFKQVNDLHGHGTGDLALKKIADVLTRHFRSDDYICRIGGDEFAVFMVHVSPRIRPLIERKVRSINQELARTDDGLPPLSLSVGVVLCQDIPDMQRVFHEADSALYQVKDSGKKGCLFYEPKAQQA